MTHITEITAERLDIELSEPFGIATGAQARALNVLCRLRCADGTLGLGEAAPFPAVSGETQEQAERALLEAAPTLLGLPLGSLRLVAERAREHLAQVPSALCAFETALFDAFCRRAGLSLHAFFGGRERTLETDITITTGSVESARSAAARAHAQGFTTLKLKVGGASQELDVERARAAASAAPGCALLLDGNAALAAEAAIGFIEALGALRDRVVLFEQPTAAEDLEGLASVRRFAKVRVAADESARTPADVARLATRAAVDVVNIKLTKSGVVAALDMVGCARAHGLGLMVGGMVESRLCMTTSACLAAGIGGFEFVDLDTPLFLRDDPCIGGFAQRGPELDLAAVGPGHGVSIKNRTT